jgi:hypothetical protein
VHEVPADKYHLYFSKVLNMSTITETVSHTITATAPKKPQLPGPNKLFAQEGVQYGDWRDDIVRDGYAVVKGAIPLDQANKYSDDILSYLENL